MIQAKDSLQEFPPSATWWSGEFLAQTGQGLEPFLFKAVVPASKALVNDFAESFKAIRESAHKTNAKTRIYVGEERRDDLVPDVFNASWPNEEELPAFIKRICKTDRFSLVVNSLQDWSTPLKTTIGAFLASYFQVLGAPIGGTELVAFAGNYSGTAFGIHRGYEHAFLVHLGPGVKDFYCWSEDLYRRETGTLEPTFGNYTRLLELGTKFVMHPGDVLYLPALVYHVGRQESFSVSVACPLYTYPTSRQLKYFLADAIHTLPDDLLGRSRHFPAEPSHGEQLNEILGAFERYREHLSSSMDRAISDHWKCLVSNGFFDLSQVFYDRLGEDMSHKLRPTATGTGYEGQRLKVSLPNRLIVDDDDELAFYIGGRRISLENGLGAMQLVKQIQTCPDGVVLRSLDIAEASLVSSLLSTGCVLLEGVP